MPKIHIKLDSFDNTFPQDNSPISLTGISEIALSNIKLNNASVVIHLIKDGTVYNHEITSDDSLSITNYETIDSKNFRRFDYLLFKLNANLENETASFDLELISP